MKVKWLILDLALTLIAVTLALRFVETEVPPSSAKAPARTCAPGAGTPGQAPVDVNGEPLASCAELDAINAAYQRDIRPIFAAKCLMCHGNVAKMPLYSKVPPSSWLVNHDIAEAKEHLDMSFDFPFTGKKMDVPQDGLEDLIDVVQENSMPPFIYKIMHWKSGLTKEERQKILGWANAGLKTLND